MIPLVLFAPLAKRLAILRFVLSVALAPVALLVRPVPRWYFFTGVSFVLLVLLVRPSVLMLMARRWRSQTGVPSLGLLRRRGLRRR